MAQDSSLADQALSDFVHLAREEDRRRGSVRDGVSGPDRSGVPARASAWRIWFSLWPNTTPTSGSMAGPFPSTRRRSRPWIPTLSPRSSSKPPWPTMRWGTVRAPSSITRSTGTGCPGGTGTDSEVDWRLGNCSFELAQRRMGRGGRRRGPATFWIPSWRLVSPGTVSPEGYFLRGEILGTRGECEAAIEAFQEVPVNGSLREPAPWWTAPSFESTRSDLVGDSTGPSRRLRAGDTLRILLPARSPTGPDHPPRRRLRQAC